MAPNKLDPVLGGGIRLGTITGFYARAKVGKSYLVVPTLDHGDLVMRKDDPEFVGRIMKIRTKSKGKCQIKVRPIHDVEGKNKRKGHWCSAQQWRKVSPLEMLSLQAEKS